MKMKCATVVYEKSITINVYAPLDMTYADIERVVRQAAEDIDEEWDNDPQWESSIDSIEIVDVSSSDVDEWSPDDVPVSDDRRRLVHRDSVSWITEDEEDYGEGEE